jgi:hypothetical protein
MGDIEDEGQGLGWWLDDDESGIELVDDGWTYPGHWLCWLSTNVASGQFRALVESVHDMVWSACGFHGLFTRIRHEGALKSDDWG